MTSRVAVYEQGAMVGSDLQNALNSAMLELAADPLALEQIGLNTDAAQSLHFTVDEEAGVVPAAIFLLILVPTASQLAADAIEAAFKAALERVRKKHGDDVVGNKVEDDEKDKKA